MWFRRVLAVLLIGLLTPEAAAQQASALDREGQVEQAVLAAPESMRAGATVLGHGGAPRTADPLTLLRAGSNDLVCLADDPRAEGFHVACYHRSLDDFMALGRRLRAEGKDRGEIMDARYAALDSGSFSMPARATLYSISSDAGPDDLDGARKIVVVYVPGATVEDLGLPSRPEGNTPWLMLPGTPWAHIMIGR